MDKEKQTPALRFRGFDGPWEKKKLGELSSLITKGTTPLNKSGKGEVNFIKIENINEESGTLSGLSKVSMTEHNGYLKRSQLKANDILFSIAGTLGRVCIVPKNILPANTNQALAIVRLKSDNLQFIKICLQGKAIKNFLEKNPTVGAQPNLSLEQVSNLEFMEPPTLLEQTKIGELGKQFNDVIFNCEQKIKKAEQFRRAMLSKLFPAEGASEPALRFRGFSGPWKKRFVRDISRVTYGGGTPATSRSEFWTGDIPWIQSSDISENDIWNVSPKKHISYQALMLTAAQKIPANSVALVTRVGVGKLAFMPFPYATSQDFLSLGDLVTDGHFTTCALQKKMAEDMDIVQGTSIKGVTKEEILAKVIAVPIDISEQKQIGDFFYQLDSYISLQREKREKLRRLKAALLEKLFV